MFSTCSLIWKQTSNVEMYSDQFKLKHYNKQDFKCLQTAKQEMFDKIQTVGNSYVHIRNELARSEYAQI